MSEERNTSISGKGVIGGGDYGEIHISGFGKITGEITCKCLHVSGSAQLEEGLQCQEEIRISGSFQSSGNMKAGELHVSGSCHCGGDLTVEGELHTSGSLFCHGQMQAEDARASGSLKVGGDMAVEQAKISGSLNVGKSLKGETIQNSGRLEVAGDCEAEDFQSSGLTRIGGLLNAEQIEIELHSTSVSKIGSIGGENITVSFRTGGSSLFEKLFSKGYANAYLETESIEGDMVSLSHVHAQVVRGREITIGEGCVIGRVEYSDTLSLDPSAQVGEQVKE